MLDHRRCGAGMNARTVLSCVLQLDMIVRSVDP
jgi:hypothetical protein